MPDLTLDPKHTAVLCMDFQNGIVANFMKGSDDLLPRTASLLAAARQAAARVIYVVVGFRPGFPEVSPRNKSFSTIKDRAAMFSGDGMQVHPAVAPQGDEVTVTKHRVSAFLGTDLDMILRANEVDTLVLSGIATSGVVLSTLRYAADSDYRIVVARDCCADMDPEVHSCLLDKVFARQATVVASSEIIKALASPD